MRSVKAKEKLYSGNFEYLHGAVMGSCHLEVYSDGVTSTILMSELGDNDGPSVTTAAATIVSKAVRAFSLDLSGITVFEEYGSWSYKSGQTSHRICRVTFRWTNLSDIGNENLVEGPLWSPVEFDDLVAATGDFYVGLSHCRRDAV